MPQVSTPGHLNGRGPGLLGPRLVATSCEFFGIDRTDLFSTKRRGQVSLARWAIAMVLYDDASWSFCRIAKLLGKDHSSIREAYDRSRSLIRTDPIFFEAVSRLRTVVNS
jgi:chromosomal replication initiation ATPase DnaA